MSLSMEEVARMPRRCAATAAMFPVKRRLRRYFSGSTRLTPLFFRFNAVNAAFLPVKRR